MNEFERAEVYAKAYLQDCAYQINRVVALMDRLHPVDLDKAFDMLKLLNEHHDKSMAHALEYLFECLDAARDRADEYSRDHADEVQDQEQKWGEPQQ